MCPYFRKTFEFYEKLKGINSFTFPEQDERIKYIFLIIPAAREMHLALPAWSKNMF